MPSNVTENYNMFEDLKHPRNLLQYTLFRGTTDFSRLEQFDLYEQGYPLLICVSVPEFLTKLAEQDNEVKTLLENYKHIIEYEFRGLEGGIDNLQASTSDITNGYHSINAITKVEGGTGTNISMRYYEKSGAIITKLHELYLRSVRDPATGFKTYNGLIGKTNGINPEDAGFHKECFSFLYLHTDNTGLLLERAIYFVGCAPTSAELGIYQGNKGDVNFQEITTEFTAYPIQGKAVNKRAKEILDWLNSDDNNTKSKIHRNSWNYKYFAANGYTDEYGNHTTGPLENSELNPNGK